MFTTGDVSFRTRAARAAIILCALGVACESDRTGPDVTPLPTQVPLLKVARARVIEPGDTRIPNPPAVAAWASAEVTDPLVTVDPASGRVYALEGGTRLVERQGPATAVVDLARLGVGRARGVAFDPTTGHLHVLDPVRQQIHEMTPTGEVVARWDVSEYRLDDAQAMTFAPTGDATDDPDAMGLYVDTGGGIIELGLIQLAAVPSPSGAATLLGTTLTSQFPTPSPDPSGVAYAAHLDNLVISDGEVDEMSIYAGANVFETTKSGTFIRGWSSLSYSREPVGAAYNPINRHLFIADDDRTQVDEVDPGADGVYGTADDQVTSFDTGAFGCTDPEGLAYHVAQGVLYIADGVNAQVFRVSPGANGIFDGVAPAGDDQATSFDTQQHGLLDPEGIAYDSDFGHLYVVGQPENLVFHLTTTGSLIRAIDISAASAIKPAGLDYAPASATAGAKSLYAVDRGVDNNTNPAENDGKLYELALPFFSGNAPPTVAITAPTNGSAYAQGDVITFTGTATDPEDGDLTASIAWTSSIDGAMGSGGSILTTGLSLGTHTITASVTDGGGEQRSASITVRVNPPGLVEVRVAASTDDAEEKATGGLDLGSSDLELVFDGSNQTIGLRFNGVTIPRGATITRAYVQFQVDETTSIATSLTIQGQAIDNAPTFASSTFNVSSRARTAASVSWSPPAWTVNGQQGLDQQTPSITSVIQEIVNRSGWSSGNSLALIITGTGERVAESYNGLASAAPLLRVEYSTGPNTAPTASNVTISGTAQVGQTLTGNYTYTDGEGDLEGSSVYRWLRNGVPISGATARTYLLVSADLGALIRFEVTPVAATGASPGTAVRSPAVEVAPPPAVSPSNSAVAASPTSILQNTGSSTITVTVKDQNGNPMAGANVVLSATGEGNSITQPSAPTNSAGVATGTLSSTVTGIKTVSATANGTAITQTATVEVLPAPAVSATLSMVAADPASIPQWTGSSTITVTVNDQYGNPMSGVDVVLSATGDGNTLTQPTSATNASGVATGTLSSTVAGTKVVSAAANGTAITATANVEVTPAPPPATQPMTHTLLTSGTNTVNQKLYTTESISPAPNALITIAVLGHNSASAAPSPIITGGGMTEWTEVATVTFDPLSLPLKRMTVYRAMSSSPGSGPITIQWSKNQSHTMWIVSQWEGADTSGLNGAGAIVQIASDAADLVNGMSVTLAPVGDVNNVAYGVFGVRSTVAAVTPGAAFTEIAEHASAESPPSALQAEWASGVNTIDASWVNLRGAVLGIEIKALRR